MSDADRPNAVGVIPGEERTSYTSPGSTIHDYFTGTLPAPISPATRPADKTVEVTKVGGEDQTSYTSPGSQIPFPEKTIAPSAPKTDIVADGIEFINAAVLLSDHLGFLSFEEASVALLAAKACSSEMDLGALRSMKAPGVAMAEGLRRGLPLIREAVEASLESRLRRVSAAVRDSKKMFGEAKGPVIPVATLNGVVVVANAKGELYRATYEDSGKVAKISKVEKISENRPTGIAQLLTSAVSALMEGKKDKAKVHLRDLLAQSSSSVEFSKARHQHVLNAVKTESFWRAHVLQNSTRMRTFVRGSGLEEVYRSGVHPRFQGSQDWLDERSAEQHKEPVKKALRGVLGKFSKMREDISSLYNRDQWLVNSLHVYDKLHGMEMSTFLNRFVGDLMETLTTLENGLRQAISEDDVRFQASLHDTIATAYPDIALGYLFSKKALGDIKAGI